MPAGILLAVVLAQSSPILQWTDDDGVVHFTDDARAEPKGKRAKPLGDSPDVVLEVAPAAASQSEPAEKAKPYRGDHSVAARFAALVQDKRFDDARQLLVQSPPEEPRAVRLVLSVVKQSVQSGGDGRAQTALVEQVRTLLSGDAVQAAAFAFQLALVHLQHDRIAAALAEVQAACAKNPSDPRYWEVHADLLREDPVRALAVLQEGLRHNPGNQGLTRRAAYYERFTKIPAGYKRQESAHFTVTFPGAHPELGKLATEILEQARREVGALYGHLPSDRLFVVLFPDEDMGEIKSKTSWAHGRYDGRILAAAGGARARPGDFRRLLFHEYAHAVFERATRKRRGPTWLNEGLAQIAEQKAHRYPDSSCVGGHGKPVRSLMTGGFGRFERAEASVAYDVALHAAEALVATGGEASIPKLLAALGSGARFDQAFETIYSAPWDAFSARFDARGAMAHTHLEESTPAACARASGLRR